MSLRGRTRLQRERKTKLTIMYLSFTSTLTKIIEKLKLSQQLEMLLGRNIFVGGALTDVIMSQTERMDSDFSYGRPPTRGIEVWLIQ